MPHQSQPELRSISVIWSAVPDASSVIVTFVVFAVDKAAAPEGPMPYGAYARHFFEVSNSQSEAFKNLY